VVEPFTARDGPIPSRVMLASKVVFIDLGCATPTNVDVDRAVTKAFKGYLLSIR
jgi:hypothetical protein